MARKPTKAAAAKRSNAPVKSKKETVLSLLRRKNGATVNELAKATGWQDHSVRGFLSGTVKKKLALKITTDKPEGGAKRYYLKSA